MVSQIALVLKYDGKKKKFLYRKDIETLATKCV